MGEKCEMNVEETCRKEGLKETGLLLHQACSSYLGAAGIEHFRRDLIWAPSSVWFWVDSQFDYHKEEHAVRNVRCLSPQLEDHRDKRPSDGVRHQRVEFNSTSRAQEFLHDCMTPERGGRATGTFALELCLPAPKLHPETARANVMEQRL